MVFPPVAAIDARRQHYQSTLNFEDDIEFDTTAFRGLTTYANMPYVNCVSEEGGIESYDIAILGAPFDTVSLSKSTSKVALVDISRLAEFESLTEFG